MDQISFDSVFPIPDDRPGLALRSSILSTFVLVTPNSPPSFPCLSLLLSPSASLPLAVSEVLAISASLLAHPLSLIPPLSSFLCPFPLHKEDFHREGTRPPLVQASDQQMWLLLSN